MRTSYRAVAGVVTALLGLSFTSSAIATEMIDNANMSYDKDLFSVRDSALHGWQQKDGRWFYYVGNQPVSGWLSDNGNRYFLDDEGVMVTGWMQNQLGEYFYFDPSGAMTANRWIQTNNRWYYLGDSGVMLVDQWLFAGGQWYYFGSDGAMVSGWAKDTTETTVSQPLI